MLWDVQHQGRGNKGMRQRGMRSDAKSCVVMLAMASREPPGDPAVAQQEWGRVGCLCTGCRGKSCLRAALQEKEEKTLPGLVLSPVPHWGRGESVPSHFHVIRHLPKPRGRQTPHCGGLKDSHTLPQGPVTLYGKTNTAEVITLRILRSSTCIQCSHVSF